MPAAESLETNSQCKSFRDDPDIPKGSRIFIGPQGSGKTVAFVAAMDRLSRLAADGSIPRCEFRADYLRDQNEQVETQSHLKHNADLLASGEWSTATDISQHRVFKLTRKGSFWDTVDHLAICDYPGKSFDAAFMDPAKLKQADSDGLLTREAEKLLHDMSRASGIFLTIDGAMLFNGLGDNPGYFTAHFSECLTRMTQFLDGRHLQQSLDGWLVAQPSSFWLIEAAWRNVSHWFKGRRKIAVLFTKSDVLPESFRLLEQLKNLDPYFLNNLRDLDMDCRFFRVSAVPKTKIDEKTGCKVPDQWSSEKSTGILDAMAWMLDLNLPGNLLKPETSFKL